MRDGRRLIVTADDMGFCAGWDEAITRAWGRGIVTTASVATTGRSYEDAARTLQREGADHGVHLDLLDGAPLSPVTEVASLVDRRGRFHSLGALLLRFASGRLRIAEVGREWQRQIARAIGDGLRPTHLNGHYHLHLLPGLFQLAVRLATRFGIGWVRMPGEPPWFALQTRQLSASRFTKGAALWALSRAQRPSLRTSAVGHVDCRGASSGPRGWERTLRAIRGEVTEIFCHPGQSVRETEALLLPELRIAIDARFRRTSFGEIHGAP